MAQEGGLTVEAAFLGGGEPDLRGAIGRLAGAGTRRVIVIPYFLTLGLHLQRDLPELVREAGAAYPNMEIELTPAPSDAGGPDWSLHGFCCSSPACASSALRSC